MVSDDPAQGGQRAEAARHVAFVLRCSVAAALAYLLAKAIGLPFPVWASMSSLIVSQEKLTETKSALLWRMAGTVIGIALAVLVGSILAAFSLDVALQIAGAVALCAALVRRWPKLRVAMWTVPVVYLSTGPDVPLVISGVWRGTEVILGALIGVLLHWFAEMVIDWVEGPRRAVS